MTMTLIDVIPAANILGEGVQWNADDGAFWWTDIQARQIWRRCLRSGDHQIFTVPERVGSFAFVAGHARRIVAAFETGVGLYDLESGKLEWLHRLETLGSGRRGNDGRTDRNGRFWFGTMVEDAAKVGTASASLYRLDRDGSLHRLLGDIAISNGLCFSPTSHALYFADSPTRRIRRFAFNATVGTLAGPEEAFAETPEGHYPDGATIDSAGHLWSAQWGGWQVVRYRPDGSLERTLRLPVEQPTCLAFGGERLDTLCIVSARDGLSPAALQKQPQAGHAFLYHVDVAGLPEVRYQEG
jgi:L-arabinonolactonase